MMIGWSELYPNNQAYIYISHLVLRYLTFNFRDIQAFLADPGEARGCSTNTFVINSVSDPLVKISLRRRHALMVGDSASSHKIDYVRKFQEILNLEGHQNCITGLRVTAILLNGWILPIGEFTSGRVCACSLRSRLV